MSTRPDVTRAGTPDVIPIDARTVRTRISEIGGQTLRTPGGPGGPGVEAFGLMVSSGEQRLWHKTPNGDG